MKKISSIVSLLMITLFITCSAAKNNQKKIITLTPANTVTIRGAINELSVLQAQIDLFSKRISLDESEPIYIVLDSPGGSIFDGEAFIEFALTLPNVHTITLFGASMAHGIAQAIPGKRYATSNSILMAHRASGGFNGQFNDGELESRLKLWKEIVQRMELRNAERLGLNIKDYKLKVINEWWCTGSNCKKENVVDEIISIKCSKELTNTVESKLVPGFLGFPVELKYSACPLIRSPLPKAPKK